MPGPDPAGSPPPPAVARVSYPVGLGFVLLAATGFGFLPLFMRGLSAAGVSAEAAVLIRFGVPAVALAYLLPRVIAAGRDGWRLIFAGAFMGLGAFGYFRGIETLDIAVAAMIFFTFPFFTIAYRWVFLRERTSRRTAMAAAIAAVAIGIVLRPGAVSLADLPEIAITFLGPAAYGALIIVVGLAPTSLGTLATAAALFAGTAVSVLPLLALGDTGAWLPADGAGWFAFFGMMVLSGLVPQFAIVIGTRVVGPSRTAVAATLELVVALAVGWLIIGEAAAPADYLGAGLILVAILLAVTDRVG